MLALADALPRSPEAVVFLPIQRLDEPRRGYVHSDGVDNVQPESFPEADISSRPHLPLATEYLDRNSLKDVRDTELREMLDECAVWTANAEDFQGSLITPSALVLWKVLIAEEIETVDSAILRVVEEIDDRRKGGAGDAVHAPGEESRGLDGEKTDAFDDEHAPGD
ncbi:hypothetical protein Sa4125_21500 [Aureimonas sp. SA4125]|nr:hypothetical protein Sa4125_21500 [Aureimonas sp. SA4125]